MYLSDDFSHTYLVMLMVLLLVLSVLVLFQSQHTVLVLVHIGELVFQLLVFTGRQGWFGVVLATIATQSAFKRNGRIGAVTIITTSKVGRNLEKGKVNVSG